MSKTITFNAFFLFTLASSALAAGYTSNGSAGELIASAEVISGSTSLDSISGSFTITNGVTFGDLYKISIGNPAAFSASTTTVTTGVNNFDTQLFLFDSTGKGLVADDDTPTSPQAMITANSPYLLSLSAGVYYLLIEGSGRYPVDASGNYIFPNILNGADPSVNYGANSNAGIYAALLGNSNEGGSYNIALTGAQFIGAPEPSGGTLALAASAFFFGRRKRRLRSRSSSDFSPNHFPQ
jgi:hypothetical protein